jgi:hypothetical protein
METIFKPILKEVFIPSFSTKGVICEDGTIYIYLQANKAYTRDDTLNEPYFTKEMLKSRLKIFDDLEAYYKKNLV